MLPRISIIIPCYNSGKYIQETLDSVHKYPEKGIYEIVIINDGSTDHYTLKVLNELEIKGYTIVHQENKGPAAARNRGVIQSSGEYLLFLDSDNKVRNSLIDTGLKIFDQYKDVGVVYGNPYFFGNLNPDRQWVTHDFDMEQMLICNYIDMCSMVRRTAWNEVGGFDENRIIMGYADWEFWIRIGKTKWKFYYANETLYDYRISTDSLITRDAAADMYTKVLQYVYNKHLDLVVKYLMKDRYKELYDNKVAYDLDRNRPLRSFVKFFYLKYLKPLRKNSSR